MIHISRAAIHITRQCGYTRFAHSATIKFTASVLDGIKDRELRKELHLDGEGPDAPTTVNWIGDGIKHFEPIVDYKPKKLQPKPIAPIDLLRQFYLYIAEKGLKKTFKHANKLEPVDVPKNRPVIIVGAGMSGLVAGYELKNAGYDVTILEMSERFGGRVKTVGQKEGFDRGLWADAGAMRLPLTANKDRPVPEMLHYLTDYYAEKKFNLKPIPFNNHSDNAFYNYYGNPIKMKEYKRIAPSVLNEYWPGWNKRLMDSGLYGDKKGQINTIDTTTRQQSNGDTYTQDGYYNATIGIVTDLLRNRIAKIPPGPNNIKEQAKQWDLWIQNWSQFSFGSFVRSTAKGIKSQLAKGYLTPDEEKQVDKLDNYLPWPDAAITAYTVVDYYLALDVSLGKWLIEEMAQWFSLHMHTLEGGLQALPNAFASSEEGTGNMEENITYNRSVTKVEYIWESNEKKYVKVSGVITSSGEKFCVEGHAVILTPALHIIRGIKVMNATPIPDGFDQAAIKDDPIYKPFPVEFQKAIQNISYTPSTKIMLQYKKQFWNTGKDPEVDICAGCSKTSLPISQLYYPTETGMFKASESEDTEGPIVINGEEYVPAPVAKDQKGILMVYTWKSEALLWGALTKDMAIRLAVDQVDELHPGSKDLFEVGTVEAWASDPTTLGGFCILRPHEYLSVLYLMKHRWRNVYFAGEGISFASGWIQGALESGLRAAYQLYEDDQPPKPLPTKVRE